MKKRLAYILIAVLIFTQIFTNFINAAESTGSQSGSDDLDKYLVTNSMAEYSNANNFNEAWNNGKTDTYEDDGKTTSMPTAFGIGLTVLTYPFRILARVILIIPQILHYVMSLVISDENKSFTIEDTLTNSYKIFNLKYLVEKDTSTNTEKTMDTLYNSISVWFVGIRNLCAVIIAIMLIYVGTRMAIATVAEEKATYKQMLIGWFEGVILLAVLHIFIIFLIELSDWMVDFISKVAIENRRWRKN